MLVAGYWILKGNCPYFIPAKDGISDSLQQASSIQYLALLHLANRICFSSTRRFEAELRYFL
jgi:hypothetical protein